VRWRLRILKEGYECLEVPKEEYERVQQAMKDMGMPFLSVDDFLEQQIKNVLEKYAEWTSQREEYEKKGRRKS
jgi:NH3-dependent NAD+ synthetase